LSFTATATKHHTVALNWVTLNEFNTDQFILEKSQDGIHFTSFGYVPAAGLSSEERQYAYVDGNPFSGISFYRIKEMDIDGLVHYSHIAQVQWSQGALFEFSLIHHRTCSTSSPM
jgi:hypothetical protein